MIFKTGNKVFASNGRMRITTESITPGYVLYVDAKNTDSYLGTGTNWNDLSPNNYDGTLVNNPSFVTTSRKNFLVNATSTVNFTTANALFGSITQFTIDMFLSVPNFTGTKNFIEKYQAGGYELIMGVISNQIYAWVYDNSSNAYRGRTVTNIQNFMTAGVMSQITFTWDGGDLSSSVKIFINGVQRDNNNFSAGVFTTIRSSATTLRIGGSNGGLGSSSPFNVSALAVYNRVLNLQELNKNNTFYNT